MFQWYKTLKQRWLGQADLETQKTDAVLNVRRPYQAWLACVSGTYLPLEKVPDATFANKLVGDGVAIEPDLNTHTVVAPATGTITKIFKTQHAFSMRSEEGFEFFVHVGIDSVKLKGEGFQALASEGDTRQAGEPVLSVNFSLLKQRLASVATILVINNLQKTQILVFPNVEGATVIAGQTPILKVQDHSPPTA